jgi:hypothetical protein
MFVTIIFNLFFEVLRTWFFEDGRGLVDDDDVEDCLFNKE